MDQGSEQWMHKLLIMKMKKNKKLFEIDSKEAKNDLLTMFSPLKILLVQQTTRNKYFK
jgi:hypothetical protein